MTMPRIIMIALVVALSACSKKEAPQLSRIKDGGDGPNEFTILPGKPLQAPVDFASLPAPTPGGSNLTDPNPQADGIAALGGNAGALQTAGIPPRDGGLVRHAGRFGTNPNIRQVLAADDNEIRRRHGRRNILNIGPVDDYTNTYKKHWLNSHAELERLRRAGVSTPSAPPPPK